MLKLDAVSKTYQGPEGPVTGLDAVSLSLDAGDFAAVQGPSGCGKSTLLLCSGALLSADAGQVSIADTDCYALSGDERARFRASHIGFVFQQFHLIPYLDVHDNILAPSLAIKRSGLEERAQELVERFGLGHRLRHIPAELSTGERQRVGLARALLMKPQLILADEPTGNLDPDNAELVLTALKEFTAQGGAVLMVTHEDSAAAYANRQLRMDQGKLVS